MKIHHIAIWTFHLEKLRNFTLVTLTEQVMKNTLIPKRF